MTLEMIVSTRINLLEVIITSGKASIAGIGLALITLGLGKVSGLDLADKTITLVTSIGGVLGFILSIFSTLIYIKRLEAMEMMERRIRGYEAYHAAVNEEVDEGYPTERRISNGR